MLTRRDTIREETVGSLLKKLQKKGKNVKVIAEEEGEDTSDLDIDAKEEKEKKHQEELDALQLLVG